MLHEILLLHTKLVHGALLVHEALLRIFQAEFEFISVDA